MVGCFIHRSKISTNVRKTISEKYPIILIGRIIIRPKGLLKEEEILATTKIPLKSTGSRKLISRSHVPKLQNLN